MIIDCHNHPDWHGHNLSKFLKNMDTHGIDQTWLLTWDCPEDEYDPAFKSHRTPHQDDGGPVPFSRALSYVERAPDRFVLGYAPDPRRPDAIARLESAVSIYGVRLYGELKLRMMYDNPDAIRMFRYCGEHSLPVTVHIDYEFERGSRYPRPNYWYGGGIDAFDRALDECPETLFLGHAPGFWSHISNDGLFDKEMYPKGEVIRDGKLVLMMRKHKNLCCDLSAGSAFTALSRDTDFSREFIEEFQDRILFGRDFFDGRMRELLDSLGLSEQILRKLYSENALKLVPPESGT